ncbi:MAG: hypothetical protein J4G13_13830 [Dehalococcoidia bacterium]|nr:hypothetical protein [Dehalococcoidia bacterium]
MPRGGNDDNRANQMNPNNDAYWQSRGFDGRPEDDDYDDDEETVTTPGTDQSTSQPQNPSQ